MWHISEYSVFFWHESPTFERGLIVLMDALRVPLKTIQERIGHALTGQFTLDVYGGKPEWGPNLEAAQMIGAELEKTVKKLEDESTADVTDGLSPDK